MLKTAYLSQRPQDPNTYIVLLLFVFFTNNIIISIIISNSMIIFGTITFLAIIIDRLGPEIPQS